MRYKKVIWIFRSILILLTSICSGMGVNSINDHQSHDDEYKPAIIVVKESIVKIDTINWAENGVIIVEKRIEEK